MAINLANQKQKVKLKARTRTVSIPKRKQKEQMTVESHNDPTEMNTSKIMAYHNEACMTLEIYLHI
jgi:hypothetical protein